MKKIIFLCTELSGYFKAGIECLFKKYQTEILVVHYPSHHDAPFHFQFINGIKTIEKNEIFSSQLNFLINFNPDVVYIPGWADKEYLKIAFLFKKKGIPIIAGIDNPWKGTFRQWLGVLYFRVFLKGYIEYMWVAGIEQYEFVRRLGYSSTKILTGLYTADHTKFAGKYIPMGDRNNIILYAGRFYSWKGILDLYNAFNSIDFELKRGWELILVGNGPLKSKIPNSSTIKIIDFLQPSELVTLMKNSKVFCLPSWHEHWGVVVHEAACAGCAIIVSNQVSSRTSFVQDQYNGFVFQSKNQTSLQKALQNIINLTPTQMRSFSKHSIALSRQYNPDRWAATIYSIATCSNKF